MGSDKLLLPYEGRPIIDRVIDAWIGGGVDQVVVVVRADHTALLHHLQDWDVRVAAIDAPLPEMLDSVRAGLSQISKEFSPRDSDAWLLAPADLPTLAEALERLRRRNLTPLELKPARNVQGAAPLNDLAARDLARTLAQLLRAGLSFAQAPIASGDLRRSP